MHNDFLLVSMNTLPCAATCCHVLPAACVYPIIIQGLDEKKKGREVVMNPTSEERAEWLNKVLERVFLSCRDSPTVTKKIISSLNEEFVEIQRKHKFFVSSPFLFILLFFFAILFLQCHSLLDAMKERLVVHYFDLGTRAPEVKNIQVERTESIAAADLVG